MTDKEKPESNNDDGGAQVQIDEGFRKSEKITIERNPNEVEGDDDGD